MATLKYTGIKSSVKRIEFRVVETVIKQKAPCPIHILISQIQYEFGYSQMKIEQALKVLTDIGKIKVGPPVEYMVTLNDDGNRTDK